MRPWIIVLSSTLLALAAAAVVTRPELTALPHSAILPSLAPLLPTAAVTALAVYALCALLLTSGDLVADGLRVRGHLVRNPPHHGPARPDWTAAFAASGFRRLVPPPAAVQPRPAVANGTVVLQGPFQPHQARREVARLYYIGAARAHFFSALLVLAAGVVLGAAQPYGMRFLPGPIPTVAAALAVAGLVLLALLARVAVDVAAEPLIEMISRLPAETAEAGLLRRTAELLATTAAVKSPRDAAAPEEVTTVQQIPDRLGAVLEQGHRALCEAIERLSITTDGLAETTRSSIEALEAAFRASELREQALVHSGDTVAMTDLRDALAALTAVLQRVLEAPVPAEADGARGLTPRSREPDLALELRKLLQEIETAA
jgi:hypothetical protein